MTRPRKTREEKAALEKKRQRRAAAAMADYEAAKKAEREKTARLRALRLARKPASGRKADHVPDSVPAEKSELGPADLSRIGLKEKYEREYWKKKFGVSVQVLAAAVRVVGPSAEKVEHYLKDKLDPVEPGEGAGHGGVSAKS
jgi:Protein of unknown function (DUF3606)